MADDEKWHLGKNLGDAWDSYQEGRTERVQSRSDAKVAKAEAKWSSKTAQADVYASHGLTAPTPGADAIGAVTSVAGGLVSALTGLVPGQSQSQDPFSGTEGAAAAPGSGSISDWAKANPMPALAIVAGAGLLLYTLAR